MSIGASQNKERASVKWEELGFRECQSESAYSPWQVDDLDYPFIEFISLPSDRFCRHSFSNKRAGPSVIVRSTDLHMS